MVVNTLVYISHLIFLFFIIFLAIWLCFIVPTIFNTSFLFFIDIFSLQPYNNDRDRISVIENIVRPPLAAYK